MSKKKDRGSKKNDEPKPERERNPRDGKFWIGCPEPKRDEDGEPEDWD